MRRFSSNRAKIVAVGGVFAAGALVVLWLACSAPSGRVGLTAAAGLFPVMAVLAGGRAAGYLCWAVSGLLGLLLLPDKGMPLLYLLFLGLYPVVKGRIESNGRIVFEWCCKLVFFNLALTVVWFLARSAVLLALPMRLRGSVPVLYGAGNLVFIFYDIGLSRLIALLQSRIWPERRQ